MVAKVGDICENIKMGKDADFFNVTYTGDPPTEVAAIRPIATVPLSRKEDGEWFVTGDIDGDGAVEIVTARNFCDDDTPPFVTSVTAHKLDGSVLWRWGDPAAGGWPLGYDVACQIHDWDGDGRPEVILATRGQLVELDGATGAERRRLSIPDTATDCLTFADLDGSGQKRQLLLKDRYFQIWAIDYDGNELWTIRMPGGYRTAHQPYPLDIDGDGREEIMVGYALADPDGKIRWTFEPPPYDEPLGHLDCCRVVRRGTTPAEWRLACTACGHRGLVMLDGDGQKLWMLTGRHYESIDVGRLDPQDPAPRLVVDLAQEPTELLPLMVIDEAGRQLGQIMLEEPRFHALIDVLGRGHDQIVLPHVRGIFDQRGRWLARFDLPHSGNIIQRGDMTGTGTAGIAISTPGHGKPEAPAIHMFELTHAHARKTDTLGCGPNFTLY